MRILFSLTLTVLLTACYTLSGISIPEGVERAYVPLYVNNALDAPPTLYIDLTESLRDKIRDQARLVITEDQPDIEIKGTLVDFRVTAEGATAGDQTAAFARQNHLTIVLAIEYKDLNNPDGDNNWKQNFSEFFPFEGTQTLASVQDEAIQQISDQINEKIFNKAFAEDW